MTETCCSSAEAARLAALRALEVLDTAPEPRFDRLVQLAASLFDAPMAAVSLVEDVRQWFKARVGLAPSETPREWSFCSHALNLGRGGALVVPDARSDPRFRENLLVQGAPFIRFYCGVVLVDGEGHALGALCVLAPEARPVPTDAQLDQLRLLADMATRELELRRDERLLERRGRLLDLAESMAGVGHWRYEPASGRCWWSAEVYRIHGVSPDAFDPTYDAGVAFYHPDDQPALQAALADAVAQGRDVEMQLRFIRRDGDAREVQFKAACEFDGAGRVEALVGVFQDVTEQVRAVRRLERSEAFHRLLADNMADVVTRVRLDGASDYISPAIERLLGWSPEEMRGRPAHAFVHPDDRKLIFAALAEVAQGLERKSVQHRALHRDGRTIWVESHLQAVKDDEGRHSEVVAVIRDVSERRAIEQKLFDSEARFRVLAESGGDIVMMSGLDGAVSYISPAVTPVLGWRPDEVVGRQALETVHPDDRPILIEAVTAQFPECGGAPPRSVQYRQAHKDGRELWLEARPTLVFDPITGRPSSITDVIRDVTARVAQEAELLAAREAAEQAAQVKAEFLANMSHELRTPLTSVIGFGGLLAGSPDLRDGDRRSAQRIVKAGESLLAVINDVLDVSKLEAGALELDPMPFSPDQLAEDVTELLAPQAEAKGLALDVSIARDVPDHLMGDEVRLRQVLLNLVGNAVKFTASGRVSLDIRRAAPESDRVRFSVVDTGIGLTEAGRAQLFQRFTQADSSVNRRFGGTGLGLAICRDLVGLMGGEIAVESELGEGSTFWFEVPLASAEAMAAATMPPAGEVDLAGLRVLAADDSGANRELLRAMLGGYGVELMCVEDGVQAVEAAGSQAFDIILMDVQMPLMNGLDATRAIRALGGEAGATPIYALTANTDPEQIQRCWAAGMDGRIAKPIDPQMLLAALTETDRRDVKVAA